MTPTRITLFSSLSIGLLVHSIVHDHWLGSAGNPLAIVLVLAMGATIASSIIAIARCRQPGFWPGLASGAVVAALALVTRDLDVNVGLVLAGAAFAAMGAVTSMWSVVSAIVRALLATLIAGAAATVTHMIVTRRVTMPSLMMLFALVAFAAAGFAAHRAFHARPQVS